MTDKVILIDPELGWKYGFPRQLPLDVYDAGYERVQEWLVETGYPQERADYWKGEDGKGGIPYRIMF